MGYKRMDIKNILELIEAVSNSEIQKFQIEDENFKLKMDKSKVSDIPKMPQVAVQPMLPAPIMQQPAAVQAFSVDTAAQNEVNHLTVEADTKESASMEKKDTNLKEIKSPIVGTFYSAAGPDSGDFVKVGDCVKKGQTLCIIEAMKLMNEIESDFDGEIAEILVNNEDMVEYGQSLFRLK